jgi:hypothetical protein
MPDPKKKTNATSVSGIGLGTALKQQNRMTRQKYDAMSTEEKDAYHAQATDEEERDAYNRMNSIDQNDPRAVRAGEDAARIEQRKNKNKTYKDVYGVEPESEDISVLEKRGYFRTDFGDDEFKHGEVYSGEADTRRRREEYYAGKTGVGGEIRYRNYQDKISKMGAEILARTKAKKNGQE